MKKKIYCLIIVLCMLFAACAKSPETENTAAASSIAENGIEASSVVENGIEASSVVENGIEASSIAENGIEASSIAEDGTAASSEPTSEPSPEPASEAAALAQEAAGEAEAKKPEAADSYDPSGEISGLTKEAEKAMKNAYESQTMPDGYLLPVVPSETAPAEPYETVTLANLQGSWVNTYNENGKVCVDVLTINGDRGKITSTVDGVPSFAWNGEGTASIEDRSERNLCPALRINGDDGVNICTIYIRWVKGGEFYDGGFLQKWYCVDDEPDDFLYDTVTLDNLQGVWYSEYYDETGPERGFYRVILNIDGDTASLFETEDRKTSSLLWNGKGKASIEINDSYPYEGVPQLLVSIYEEPERRAGIYISSVEKDRFYDLGFKRWYVRARDIDPEAYISRDQYTYITVPKDDGSFDVTVRWQDGPGAEIKVIPDEDASYRPMADSLVWEEDVNFDGVRDVMFLKGYFAAAGYEKYECWLMLDGKLVKCEGFEDIFDPFPDTESRTVSGRVRNGADAYIESEYRIKGSRVFLIEERELIYDEKVQEYVKKEQ